MVKKFLLARDYFESFKHQSACMLAVNKMLQMIKDQNWFLPIMYIVCADLRLLAQKCEKIGSSITPGEILEKAADSLMACFRTCAADNRYHYVIHY